LGYTVSELVAIPVFCVAYGGFRTVDLKAGETVVVSPATGHFSMSAVAIADAIGASVIAVSRNADRLKQLRDIFPRVKTVVPTGDVAADTQAIVAAAGGYADVFADVSPPAAVGSKHLESCIGAVKQYGRVCLMGGRADPTLPVSYLTMVLKSLTIRGSFMYEREHVKGLIKLVESGRLPIGKAGGFPVVSEVPISRYEEAFAEADKDFGIEGMVTIVRG
jgi:threonine dehydrogenase-like Zn-dependent dehydrogenase